MDLKKVIHFYLGQKCRVLEDWVLPGHSRSRHKKGDILPIDYVLLSILSEPNCTLKVAPILRRLTDITIEDLKGWSSVIKENNLPASTDGTEQDYQYAVDEIRQNGLKNLDFDNANYIIPYMVTYLLSCGFWLFGDQVFEDGTVIQTPTTE